MDPNQRLEQIANELQGINKSLNILLLRLYPEGAAAVVEFYTTINGVREKVVNMFPQADAVLDLAVAFKAKLKDGTLVDAKVDTSKGPPVWALTNDALGKLEIAEDGMSAVFSGSGQVGTEGDVEVLADADLGDGVEQIKGVLHLQLIAPKASVVEISAVERP